MVFFSVGLKIVFVTMPILLSGFKLEATKSSTCCQVVTSYFPSAFLSCGDRRRCVSYRLNTEAWARADVPPWVTRDRGFPSILIGRPSRTFTRTLQYSPPLT